MLSQVTREALHDAFLTRFFARVWDNDCPDPSFFRDASVVLVPPFNGAKHYFELQRLKNDDEEALPRSMRHVDAPTRDWAVQEKREGIWKELRARALVVAEKEAAKAKDSAADVDSRAAKRARASTLDSSAGRVDAWARLCTAQEDVEELSPQEEMANAVDSELKAYRDQNIPSANLSPKRALQYWAGSGRLKFPRLSKVAQQVFGNQTSAAQIERDFCSARNLLSGRRSRTDVQYIEMMLFLHLNYDRIPRIVQGLKPGSLKDHLPKRFTGVDAELEEADTFFSEGL